MRVVIGLAFILAAAVGLAGREVSAAAPSFDCAKAGNWVEKQICGNDELAALDAWFAPLYGQVAQRLTGKELDDLKAERKAWLKQRNDCKAEVDGAACLEKRYREFTGALELKFADLIGSSPAAQFAKEQWAPCGAKCMEQLLEADEAKLADAEAKAGEAAAQRDQSDPNAHLGDRLAESNVAWRVYRNTECKRRQQAGADYSACLVILTRTRVRELQ
jgi:uncharacterized protein YecT (DUF1311 family)